MSNTKTPHLLTTYKQFLKDSDTGGFVCTVSKHYSAGTLERLAVHPDSLMRCAAALALRFVGDFSSNPTLGQMIQDADQSVRILASTACRLVWNKDGGEDHRQQLVVIIGLNASAQYCDACVKATELLNDLPSFAEARYQRGVAWFERDDFHQAIRDFRQALELNSYHFVAAMAMGDAYLLLGNPVAALDSFRRALSLNPDLARVRTHVAELASQIEGE